MTLPQPSGDQKPPTLERLQSLNADQIKLDDLQEVFEITRAKATSTFDASELLNHANDIGRLAILARRVTEYLKNKGIMTGSEPFRYFERLMNQEAQSIRDLSRRLTPSPAPVVPAPPPVAPIPSKPVIEIKTLAFASDEEQARWINDGWERVKIEREFHPITGERGWVVLLEREKPAEAVAPIPTTTDVGTPPVASAPATPPEKDTQPIVIIPAVPDKVAAIVALADTTPPPRPLGFLTSNLLSTITITEDGAA